MIERANGHHHANTAVFDRAAIDEQAPPESVDELRSKRADAWAKLNEYESRYREGDDSEERKRQVEQERQRLREIDEALEAMQGRRP